MIPDTLAGLAVPVDSLRPYPNNARRGDLEMIKQSLEVNGQYRPVVVNQTTMEVLAGNHTLQAAIALGWTEIAATFVVADKEQARRIVAVDNRSNDVAGYDDELLAELLQGMESLDGSGYTELDLDELLAGLGAMQIGRGKKDAVTGLPKKAVTQFGDVIDIGEHRLVCGDALDRGVCAAALSNAEADLIVTDPPYMVDYENQTTETRDTYKDKHARRAANGPEIVGDALPPEQADAFIHAMTAMFTETLAKGAAFYCFCPPGEDQLRFRTGLLAAKLPLRQVLIWVKDRFVFGRQDYQWRHEPILYGWRPGAAHFFVDDHTQDTVLLHDRPSISKDHPTQKPVELLEVLVTNSSRKGELVFDPFAGSGSTMVACMSQSRRCAMIELDPRYCDVIVKRWEKLTGLTAR